MFWSTLTFLSTEAAINATFIRFNESIAAIADIADMVPSLTLEPFPPALYARHHESNALGFDNRAGPNRALVVAILDISYTREADDQAVKEYGRSLTDVIKQDLKKLNALDPFLYLNYAAPYQDPLSSYGERNLRRLRQIATKFDSQGTFQYQVPGGFKLFPR